MQTANNNLPSPPRPLSIGHQNRATFSWIMSSSFIYYYSTIVFVAFVVSSGLVNCYSIKQHRQLDNNTQYSICGMDMKEGGILVCQLNVVPGQAAKINKCIKQSTASKPKKVLSCESFTTSSNICTISLELEQVVTVMPFKKDTCKTVKYIVTLSSITFDDSNDDIRIVDDLEATQQVYIQNSHFDTDLGYVFSFKFPLARTCNITSMDTSLSLIPDTFNYTLFPRLNQISMSSSKLGGLDKRALVLGENLTSLFLSDVKVEGNISSGAIVLESLNCSKVYSIQLKDLTVPNERVDKDFIEFKLDNHNKCPNPVDVSLSVEGNSLDKIIHENMFKNLLENAFSSNHIHFIFSSYEIECCLPGNRWLFNLTETLNNKKNLGRFKTYCLDLGESFADFRNQTEFEEVCYNRNVSPILIMAIVASLVLATLLGIFTLICVYHVIPKKNQEIMISRQSSVLPFSKIKVAATKVSDASVISNKTAGSQLLSNQTPLLSGASISDSALKKKEALLQKTLKSTDAPKSLGHHQLDLKHSFKSQTNKTNSLPKTPEDLKKLVKGSLPDMKNTSGPRKRTSKESKELVSGAKKQVLISDKVVKKVVSHSSKTSSPSPNKEQLGPVKSTSLRHKKRKHHHHKAPVSPGAKPKGTKARFKTVPAKKLLNLPTIGQGKRSTTTTAATTTTTKATIGVKKASKESFIRKQPSNETEKTTPSKELITTVKTDKSSETRSIQDTVSPASPQQQQITKEPAHAKEPIKNPAILNKSLDERMSEAFNTVND